MESKYLKELNKIFVSYFNNKKISINEKTTSKDIKNWDSLAQVGIIILTEKKFKIKFSVKEVGNLKKIGDIVRLIIAKKRKK
ncbi:acyl carrier protein [Candidatus Pelagibacter sp.]|nr:acyl carrier protein [Candidatus Pelagibacter sp.]|tara:strand:- start:170 stop:415 length:246 start_codon:yes stop_codon:yes gene_type:complete